jgi:hypothetical protein
MAKQKSSSINPELIKRMALLADSMLKSGVGDQDVHAALMKQGVSPEKLRKQSQRDLRIGAVVLVIGLLASILLGAGVIVEPSGYALLVTFCVMIIAGVLLGRAIMDQRTVKQAETKQG